MQRFKDAVVALLISGLGFCAAAEPPRLHLKTNDVIAWVGGSDVAAALEGAHLESLLAMHVPEARFRNFGWEGDTVFSQPRDVGFPPLAEHLAKAKVSFVLLQFGRGEALNGRASIDTFRVAAERMGTNLSALGFRVAWIAPPPFERGPDLLPDLTLRNPSLEDHIAAIGALCSKHQWPFLNPGTERGEKMTVDGLQLSQRGHALFAIAVARQLGFGDAAARAGEPSNLGSWINQKFERVRQLEIEKNRYWLNYWRPHNWAFLGGDRISQPSSRDHRDQKIRWFPDEMQRYLPLIEEKERAIAAAARSE